MDIYTSEIKKGRLGKKTAFKIYWLIYITAK